MGRKQNLSSDPSQSISTDTVTNYCCWVTQGWDKFLVPFLSLQLTVKSTFLLVSDAEESQIKSTELPYLILFLCFAHSSCTKQNSTLYQVGSSYISTCMLKNLQEPGRLILQDCGDAFYQAFTELNGPRSSSRQESTGDARHPTTSLGPRIFLPQHFELKQLYRQFPKATWILNQRNVASWVDSVLNWEEEEPGAGSLKTQLINEYHMQYGTELQPVDERQFLEWLYYNHTNTVKEFHKSHATISLIEMDIEDPGAGRKLGATTGLDPFCWNQQNKNDG
jgi:hypothetical protein